MKAVMHSELQRLERDFGWRPEAVATWDDKKDVWLIALKKSCTSAFENSVSETIDLLVDESWWYRTRNFILLTALRKAGVVGTIWDIGSGTGVVGNFLSSHGIPAIGVEPSHAGAIACARRGSLSFCASLDDLKLPRNSVKAVSMLDVLEHLDDREVALQGIHKLLSSSGYLILTVPALATLWSQADVDAGHYLRYSKRRLREELEANGFEVLHSGYFFALTVLPLFFLRALPFRLGLRKAMATDATLGTSGGVVGKFAAFVEQKIALRVPFGSSLLVIARKREDRVAR